tara:strand:- start:40 stop:255 length:216 start_codon:yes stop_codon:yes gene_type:complete
MQEELFAMLSSEEKVLDIKSRIATFKAKNPHLYPEERKEVMPSGNSMDTVPVNLKTRISRLDFTKSSNFRR